MAEELQYRVKVTDEATGELRAINAEELKLLQTTERSSEATDKAASKAQVRSQRIQSLKTRLEELATVEARHQRRVTQGVDLSDADRSASVLRRHEMDRIGRVLGGQLATQAQANELVRQSTRVAAEAAGAQALLRGAVMSGVGSVGALAGGLAGPAGLIALYRAWDEAMEAANRRLEENIRLTAEQAQAKLNLQFLSQDFDPETVAFAKEAAAMGGRDPVEGLRAFADLKSRRPNADNAELRRLFLEVTETGKTTYASLESITNAYLTLQRFEPDSQKAQNLLRQSQIEAGVSDPSKLSPLFAKFLGTGTGLGNLSVGEAAGNTAAVTGLGLNPEEAVTGLRAITSGLMGKGTPGGMKIMEREGIDRTNLNTAMADVVSANRAGRITDAELEELVGREGLPVLSTLSTKGVYEDFTASSRRVAAVQNDGRDLTREAIQEQFGKDEIGALDLLARQMENLEKTDRGSSTNAARANAAKKTVSKSLNDYVERGDISPARSEAIMAAFEGQLSLGQSPEDAARVAGGVFPTVERFTGAGGSLGYLPVNLVDPVRRGLETRNIAPAENVGPGRDESEASSSESVAPTSTVVNNDNSVNIGTQYVTDGGPTPITGDTDRRNLQ